LVLVAVSVLGCGGGDVRDAYLQGSEDALDISRAIMVSGDSIEVLMFYKSISDTAYRLVYPKLSGRYWLISDSLVKARVRKRVVVR